MMGSISSNSTRLILSLLILLGFSSTTLLSQKNLSGNLNQPKSHVVTIGVDRVTVDDVTGFSNGDTILLIQMQGVGILAGPSDFGNIQTFFGQPGMHEFLIIQTVIGDEIVFRNDILENYDPKGNIQIVRVPYYNSATVTGRLFCDQWNSTTKKGGVLALIIGRTLKLNADIDVSKSGFIGGKDTIGEGRCVVAVPATDIRSYPQSFLNAGYKGEGLAIHNDIGTLLAPLHMKGMGPNFTGGGGGNGRFSGGGGGSNRGVGGIGGSEDNYPSQCGAPQPGGLGGIISEKPIEFPQLIDRIYFGGGGGASISLTGLSPSGGNGGGIVIIVSDTIIGNGGNILSNGGDGGTAVVNGGSGGGGGGGSIALSLNSYGSTPLGFSVSGGKGGDNPGTYGEGGGGGGGLLYVSTNTIGNVTLSLDGGHPGNDPSSTAFAGGTGEKRVGFKAILNGFLFNSIRSSVTGDQLDYVCSNMLPPKITGTKPVGGTGPYSYLWEKSYDEVSWTPLSNDADPTNYTPTLDDTTTSTGNVWFRRIITDSSVPTVLVDISKPVKIIVQPFIKKNIVGTSDTICFAQDPPAFTSKETLLGGNGIYAFKWEVSLNNSLFNLPANTYSTEGYTPLPALKFTSWYRRTVTSGSCVDSTAIVKITVLDTIRNNKILNSPLDICYGMIFTDLSATTAPTLAGGDNSYRFKWESNINGAGWGTATGVSSGVNYNPVEQPERVPWNEYFFRRVVYSGMNDVCVNTSNTVLLKDFPVITNNTITANQTICSGSAPSKLIGSIPLNGNGTYNYTWQDSTKSHIWTDIPGAINILSPDYQPPPLTDTTSYRRIVFSSACSDISKSIKIIVHKPILNNNISLLAGGLTDTTICNGQVPHKLKGTVANGGNGILYNYQWLFSTDNSNFIPVPVAGTGVNLDPASLAITTYYKRQVISGACTVISSATITVNVLQSITNNIISSNQTVCFNKAPNILTGGILSGGAVPPSYSFYWEQSTDGTTWAAASGTSNSPSGSYQPPTLIIPMKYRRTVTSGAYGCCTSISNVIDITIHPPLPTGTLTSATDTICNGSQVPIYIHLTGASKWNLVYNENSTSVQINKIAASDTIIKPIPSATTSMSTFTYSLVSLTDKYGCSATSLTGTRKVNVYNVPKAFPGNDTAVCGPTFPLRATPSYGTGKWYEKSVLIASTPSLTVTVDSTFSGGNVVHTYTWEEINWQCKNKDSVIITFDKRVSSINAGPDILPLYSFDNIVHLVADSHLPWETGLWTKVSGTGEFDGSSDSLAVVVRNLSKGLNTFLWTITNGTCKLVDLVNIDIVDIFIPKGFSPNKDPDNYNNTFIISGLDLQYQVAELTIVNGAGTEVFSTSNRPGQTWTDWDGTNSKGFDLPEGTYYYLLKITSTVYGQVFKKSGFIVLKRY